MMKDFKIIEAAGTPYEIGFAHGEQGREEVLCSIATYKEMFKTYANLGWEEAKHRSRAYIEHISRYDSDLLEEIRGVAAGAGVELEDILALNARSEVILMSGSKMPSDGCTAVAVTPESTQDRHTILAQNWDWKGRQIEAVLVLKIIQQDKPAITMVTEGGIIGKVGFNDAGIGVCLNALGTVGNPYGLPLHIGAHQRTVGVVVLQERDKARGDRGDLVRSHVHQVHFAGRDHGEIGAFTRLDAIRLQEIALPVDRGVRLCGDQVFLLLGRIVVDVRIVHIDLAVLHAAVRRLDEAHRGDLRIDAQRRDQTDVRAFRRLDRAKASVVRVVHVAHLETGAVARQTAGTERRQTAFVRNFGQRVDLVHELRELRGSEEGVDHRRKGLGVDQVHRREHLVVTHVHALADRTRHAHETDRELIRQLLAHRADAAVRQVVDVVDVGLRVDQLDQVFDDGDDVLARQRADGRIGVQIQLLVDAVTAHIAQVIAFVREEQLLDDVARRSLIGRLRSAQLPVNIYDSLLLGVAGVFLQGIVYDREIDAREVFLMQEDRLGAAFEDLLHVLLLEDSLAVYDHVVTLDGNHLARILIHEVLDPGRKDACGKFAADGLLEVGLRDLYFVCQVENLEDLLVGLITDGTQQRSDGQLLFTVDVRIHHVVDVRSELDPRTLERNDSRRVELGAVRVHALSEEHAGRTVQLGYDDTLRTVDDERTAFGHIGDRTEVHVLNDNAEIFVFVVRAVELQLGFQRNAVRQTALQALLDRVTGRVDIVVDKLQNEIVPGIRDGEIFLEDLVEALVLTVFGRGVHLEKVPE